MASLNGTVSDPDGAPVTKWTKVSGLGTVVFADATAVDTTATFGEAGTYVLQLSADDGFGPVVEQVTITVSEAAADADGDGIDDAWEVAHFGNTGGDGSGDSDGDGVADFFEYLCGSDPNLAGDGNFRVSAGPLEGRVCFDWAVSEGFVLGIDYIVEVSTDLSNPDGWGPLPGEHCTLQTSSSEGMTIVDLEITEAYKAIYGDHVFIRLVQP